MTSRPVRIGVQLQPQHVLYPKIRDTVRAVEDMGADILFNWDHFFPLYGDKDGLHFEAWTELGSWAELTSRIEFGTLVNCNSYRNADLQADMARTLDHICGWPLHLRHRFGLVRARLRRVRLRVRHGGQPPG